MMHITDNQEALLDYLYEEGDPAERIKIARHLQECAPCSVAVLELQSVRGVLSEWTPPAATLGFKVVQSDAATPSVREVSPASRGWRPGAGWPAWAQAAAAVFLFVAGMGVSQLRVEYGNGTLTVRTGPAAQAALTNASEVGTPPESPQHTGTDIPLVPMPTSVQYSRVSVPTRDASGDEVMQLMKTLVDQSESRQKHELALRISELMRDFDTQRQADMRRVDQNFGQLEGQTAAEVARSRELVNSLVKVSQGGAR